MKTVHIVEYGCHLKSGPQRDEVAQEVVRRLREKDIQCYVADLTQQEAQEVLARLKPTAGTDPDFDYDRGEFKAKE